MDFSQGASEWPEDKRGQGLNSLQGYPYCFLASFELSISFSVEILLLASYKRIWGQIFQNWSLTLPTVPLKNSQKRQK